MSDIYRRIQWWLYRYAGRPFPPPPGTRRVVDLKGRMYYLADVIDEQGATYSLFADPPRWCHRGRVGNIELLWLEEAVLELANLHLEPFARSCGLGIQLFSVVRQYAETHRAASIVGTVNRTDLKETPHLLDWYEHQGFKVSHREDTYGAANIMFHLRPSPPGHNLPDLAGASAEHLEV